MYDVALLVEHRMEPLDADQVVALHEGLDDTVTYHLLLPVRSSAAMLASSLGAIGNAPVPISEPDTVLEVQEELHREAEADAETSATLLRERGGQVTVQVSEDDPVSALGELVASTAAAEVIILTEPHVVQSFFHVDWSSRAKRHLDVPTLHLLEHVPFAAQA